tara:strand:+ start:1149 stop:1445 length:297 start_codon:yes stop_codon:yes gene_type:complete
MNTDSKNTETEQCTIPSVSSSFKAVVFANDTEFADYVQSKKPKEIWLDEFSKDEPYIIISSYYGNRLSGCYNHQTLLGAKLNDCYWLFEDGMYVKNYC